MSKNILNIKTIKKYVATRKIEWTKHCLNRIQQRNISSIDIKIGINNGEIIEYYLEDYPYPSCLISGYDINTEKLHIVCGINNEKIYIITAYRPDKDRWDEDMKTRRRK